MKWFLKFYVTMKYTHHITSYFFSSQQISHEDFQVQNNSSLNNTLPYQFPEKIKIQNNNMAVFYKSSFFKKEINKFATRKYEVS